MKRKSLLLTLGLLSLGLASCRRITWELVSEPAPKRETAIRGESQPIEAHLVGLRPQIQAVPGQIHAVPAIGQRQDP